MLRPHHPHHVQPRTRAALLACVAALSLCSQANAQATFTPPDQQAQTSPAPTSPFQTSPAESTDPDLLTFGSVAPSLAGLRAIPVRNLHDSNQPTPAPASPAEPPSPIIEPGIIHVIDAWATWCLPCERTIPHLSRLATAYQGRVRVLGVATWEQRFPLREGQQSYESRVRDYVRTRADRIAYDIAWDESGVFERAWMRASRSVSIPTVFLVDATGTIAWIGHPMMGLDQALAELLAGTFDAEAAFDRTQRQRVQSSAGFKDATQLQLATREERWNDAITIAKDIFSRDKAMFASSGVTALRLMLTRGEPADALAFIEAELNEFSTLSDYAKSQRIELLADAAEALLDSPQALDAAPNPSQFQALASRLAASAEAIISRATTLSRTPAERDQLIAQGEPLVLSVRASDALTLAGVRMRLQDFARADELLTAALALDPDPSEALQAQAMQRQLAALRASSAANDEPAPKPAP